MQTFKIKRYDYVTAAKACLLIVQKKNKFYVLVEYNDVKAKYTEA